MMYHVIICPVVADIRVRQERRLVDHGQPEGTNRKSVIFTSLQSFINMFINVFIRIKIILYMCL